MALTSPVIELKGFGEATPTKTTTQPVNLQDLIQQMMQVGINQWKYKMALKMAKKPCQKDPAHCGYYIMQAMRSLGFNPPPEIQNITWNQASQINQELMMYPEIQPGASSSKDDTWKYLLLGGGIIAGIFLVKYLSERG